MTVDKFGRMSDAGAVYTEGVSLRYINNNFLRRDGTNTATGSINMTGNTLTNVSNPVIDQDVATKNYVDTNSSSDKVSKSGDTMTGHLNMSGNLIIGLPTTYPPITYIGDEATSWDQTVGLVQDAASILVDKSGDTMTGDLDMSGNRVTNVPYAPVNTSDAANAAYVIQGDLDVEQKTVLRDGTQAMTGNLNMDDHFINNLTNPVNAQDAATKNYVDQRKPIISIHAEESEPIVVGEYQWSFGNGATGNGFATCGYVMMSSGRLLRMGLSSVTGSGATNNLSTVGIVVNGTVDNTFAVTKPLFQYSGTNTFITPKELSQGDVINFRSLDSNSIAAFSIVCAIIELDM